MQPGAHAGVGAAHRQQPAQPRCEGQHEQPEPEGRGDSRTDLDPCVVDGPFGELPGQVLAPAEGGPPGAHGDDVVEEGPGEEQEQESDDSGGDAARGPEAAGPADGGRVRGAGPLLVRRRCRVRSGAAFHHGQALGAALSGPGALRLAHRVLPCLAPYSAARCRRSTRTATSGTAMPTNARTRWTTW